MSGLKPEERAREWIDRKLEDAGWQVINRDEYAPGMTACRCCCRYEAAGTG